MNNEEHFKKGIHEMQSVRLTDLERAAMLERILNTPIVSPYTRYLRVLVYMKKPAAALMMASLILVLSAGTLAYASEAALPGDLLYSVKTKLVEPILDKVNIAPEKKIVWEEEKIERRIAEAKALVVEDKLDEKKSRELEKKIEKSSAAFVTAAEAVSRKTATTTEKQEEKQEELKKKFKERLEDKKEDKSDEKINRLKDRAVKVLEATK